MFRLWGSVMNILMVLSNPCTHDPRVLKEAKTLEEAGNTVTILAWDRKRQASIEETKDGVDIVRLRNTKFMDLLPYNILRLRFWWMAGAKKALEMHSRTPFNIIHCHDLDTLPIGEKIKRKLGIPLIYDSHEIWPYMIEGDVPKILVKRLLSLEKKLLKSVDYVITVGKSSRDYFRRITNKPIGIVMNCKDLVYENYQSPKNLEFTLIYIGSMSKKRFFPEIVDLVGQMAGVKLVLASSAKRGMVYEVKERCNNYKNTEFLGTIPEEELIPRTKAADATFILVDPKSKHYQRTLFNKQFEAMVCGRPIIVTNNTFAAEMTKELDCGLVVEYNGESIRETIIKLRDNPDLCKRLGVNAIRSAQNVYNWEIEKEKLLKIYERVKNG
jgi:glycosyltransferase involved in cell wall biosynthesis